MPTRKTVTGRVLAEMFFHKIVCSEGRGTPTLIQSDRGPQMVGFHFQHFHKLCGTKIQLSSGHSHTGQGLVERHIQSAETLRLY